eukprot:Nk52_evm1s336 gene=Nk52_evmTU1s336
MVEDYLRKQKLGVSGTSGNIVMENQNGAENRNLVRSGSGNWVDDNSFALGNMFEINEGDKVDNVLYSPFLEPQRVRTSQYNNNDSDDILTPLISPALTPRMTPFMHSMDNIKISEDNFSLGGFPKISSSTSHEAPSSRSNYFAGSSQAYTPATIIGMNQPKTAVGPSYLLSLDSQGNDEDICKGISSATSVSPAVKPSPAPRSSNAQIVSPPLAPVPSNYKSPALKPRRTSVVGEPAEIEKELQTKSNYQTMLEGKGEELGFAAALMKTVADRRDTHKNSEKKRRDDLKQCFHDLRDSIPNCQEKLVGGKIQPLSKVAVLRKAMEYIRFIVKEKQQASDEVKALKEENETLRKELENLKGESNSQ